MAIWNHPIDVHYYSNTMQGWPKLVLEVWKLDKYGGKQLLGYSFCTIPTSGGQHELEMSVWRPMGTPREELYDFFLGGVPHLVSKELVHNVTKAKDERVFISTKSMGKVYARVEIVLRNLKAHGVRTR